MPTTDIPHESTREPVYLGVAGWNIRKEHGECFEPTGTHLQRYASTFNSVEINSCFYRPHRVTTYERWAASVPDHFRFAVKLPKTITHKARFVDALPLLDAFLVEVAGLREKLGPILVQLPPSFAFEREIVVAFLSELRSRFSGQLVIEPRHETWFYDQVERILVDLEIARVAADPARVPEAAVPGGFDKVVYYRLHGSPRIYYSAYPHDYLDGIVAALQEHAARGADLWCIFDNTALGAATKDALTVKSLLLDNMRVENDR
jgi:uncharacterized protein YecE (DUF72 family)